MNLIIDKSVLNKSTSTPPVSVLQSFFYLCIALTYGFVLSQLPSEGFNDFNDYLLYADQSFSILSASLSTSTLYFLTNEPVWLLINSVLRFFLEPLHVVRLIIFFSASSVAWLTLRSCPRQFFWLILILMLPQVLKNFLNHLRQGFAIAIFLWGFFTTNRTLRFFLLSLTPFVHATFFIILLLLISTYILSMLKFSAIQIFAIVLLMGLALALFDSYIAQALEFRQANMAFLQQLKVSGLAFISWSLILCIMFVSGKSWLRLHAFEVSILIFYITLYWISYSSGRFFESGLNVLLLSGCSLSRELRRAFFGIIILSGIFSWSIRFNQPLLGF